MLKKLIIITNKNNFTHYHIQKQIKQKNILIKPIRKYALTKYCELIVGR